MTQLLTLTVQSIIQRRDRQQRVRQELYLQQIMRQEQQQQWQIPHSRAQITEIVSSYSRVSNIGSVYSQTLSSNANQLLETLLQQERKYISELKFIMFGVSVWFEIQLNISKQKLAEMFGEVQNMIDLHTSFVNELCDLSQTFHQTEISDKQIKQSKQQQLFNYIQSFLSYVIIYTKYIKSIEQLLQQVSMICSKNKTKTNKMFCCMQKPLQHYLLLPFNQLSEYSRLLAYYINVLSPNSILYKQYVKLQQSYKNMLLYKLQIQPSDDAQIAMVEPAGTQLLLKNLRSMFWIQKANQNNKIVSVDMLFSCRVGFWNNSCMLYLIRNGKQGNNLACFCGTGRFNQPGFNWLFGKILNSDTFVFEFPDKLWLKNQIGLCSTDSFFMLTFENNKIDLFNQKIKMLQQDCTQNVQTYIYEPSVMKLPLTFEFISLSCRLNEPQRYIFRMTLHYGVSMRQQNSINSNQKLCQYLFLTMQDIDQIFNHYKLNKVTRVDLTSIYPNQSYGFIAGLRAQQIESIQYKFTELENRLNKLVREEQVRLHPEYLFRKLGIVEGIWEAIDQINHHYRHPVNYSKQKNMMDNESKQANECYCQQCIEIQTKFTFKDFIQIYQGSTIVDAKNEFKNKLKSRLCINFWLNAYQALQLKLLQNSAFMQFLHDQKHRLPHLCLLGLELQRAIGNWNILKIRKRLRQAYIIHVMVPNISLKVNSVALGVSIEYEQQTVQILIRRVCAILQIPYAKDFGIYRQSQLQTGQIGEVKFYDRQEYLKNITQNVTVFKCLVGKRWWFQQHVQLHLMLNQSYTEQLNLVQEQFSEKYEGIIFSKPSLYEKKISEKQKTMLTNEKQNIQEETRLFLHQHKSFNVHRVKIIAGQMATYIKYGHYNIKPNIIEGFIVHIFELMLRLKLIIDKQVTPQSIQSFLPAQYIQMVTQKSPTLKNNNTFTSLSLLVKHIKIQNQKQNTVQQIFTDLLNIFYSIPGLVTTSYSVVYLEQSNYYAGAYRKHHTTLKVNHKTLSIQLVVNNDRGKQLQLKHNQYSIKIGGDWLIIKSKVNLGQHLPQQIRLSCKNSSTFQLWKQLSTYQAVYSEYLLPLQSKLSKSNKKSEQPKMGAKDINSIQSRVTQF